MNSNAKYVNLLEIGENAGKINIFKGKRVENLGALDFEMGGVVWREAPNHGSVKNFFGGSKNME